MLQKAAEWIEASYQSTIFQQQTLHSDENSISIAQKTIMFAFRLP
jgi:hypothetical protein